MTRYLKIVLILPPILTVSISYLVFTFARVALLSASREWQKKHKYVHFFTQTSSQVVTKLSRRILAENPLILMRKKFQFKVTLNEEKQLKFTLYLS